MGSAVAGAFILLSIGILIAHAFDAFGSGSWCALSVALCQR